MKKSILTLTIIVVLILGSCSKKEVIAPVEPCYITFTGGYNTTAHCYINGIEKKQNVVYEVFKGDVANFFDPGTASNSLTFTSGAIIFTQSNVATTKEKYSGIGITQLRYVIPPYTK